MIEVIREFISMGGHAYFIWPAYIIATVGVLGLWFFSAWELKHQKHILTTLKKGIPKNLNRENADNT